ncbi:MAG: hypothetical protein R6U95_04505 [Bacteroidales bacterium]
MARTTAARILSCGLFQLLRDFVRKPTTYLTEYMPYAYLLYAFSNYSA